MANLTDIIQGNALLNKLTSTNRYTLSVDGLLAGVSVLSVQSEEQLNQLWCYEVTFTSSDKSITIPQVLSKPASFAFNPASMNQMVAQISSLDKPAEGRKLFGIITEFCQLSVNKDEAHYRVKLQPRLALLSNQHYQAIYQNQSVVSVVEAVLRRHGFTGVDYRLELNDSYPVRRFITQWHESDLNFVQRLLADVGIWFRFESHAEHSCDVLVLSDNNEQGVADAGSISYNTPSGMVDSARDSIWDLKSRSKTVPAQVLVQDYNYREAESDMHSLLNTSPKDGTLRGTDYRYGEHYGAKDDDLTPESGHWYSKIRHQQKLSEQVLIEGRCNQYHLSPGQRITISGSPLGNIKEGVIILSTRGHGDRGDAYELTFTAIPYDVLKPYRPHPLTWPVVNGTLPARVTSPSNDTYGYIDTQGRYRVKFDFDLQQWKSGEESLWVRLAKPYAGDNYGFHFPLIDGTEVAIAFTDGNPDRPYIAHSLHDSTHVDHVATANKHRNVIRTPANNKLRLDDKRGQEHIKLATEYGKTQLNLGHLVNNGKEQRGEGFELRTDEWGAIRAGKGLYVSSEAKPKASGNQLDMRSAVKQLESALEIAKILAQAAESSNIDAIDTTTQEILTQTLSQLTNPGVLIDSPSGLGIVTGKDIQFSAQDNIRVTAANNSYITVMKKIALAAGESISLFASKLGVKLFAAKGKVQIQAQSDEMELMAKKSISIISTNDEVEISASSAITLKCQGAYIKLSGGSVEIGCPGDITLKGASVNFSGPGSMSGSGNLNSGSLDQTHLFSQQFKIVNEQTKEVRAYVPYRLEMDDGEIISGISDGNGYTERVYAMSKKSVKIIVEE